MITLSLSKGQRKFRVIGTTKLNFGIAGDSNARKICFNLDRFIEEGVDLNDGVLYIVYTNAADETYTLIPDDILFAESFEHAQVMFSWTLSDVVMKKEGFVSFQIVFKHTDDDGHELIKWQSDISMAKIEKSQPSQDNPEIPQYELDLITQLIENVRSTATASEARIKETADTAIATVERKSDDAVGRISDTENGIRNGLIELASKLTDEADDTISTARETAILNIHNEIDPLISEVEDKTDLVRQYAEEAKESATSASASEHQAGLSELEAKASEENAVNAALNAQKLVDDLEDIKAISEESARLARSYSTSAFNYANTAETAAGVSTRNANATEIDRLSTSNNANRTEAMYTEIKKLVDESGVIQPVPEHIREITEGDISNWNNKADKTDLDLKLDAAPINYAGITNVRYEVVFNNVVTAKHEDLFDYPTVVVEDVLLRDSLVQHSKGYEKVRVTVDGEEHVLPLEASATKAPNAVTSHVINGYMFGNASLANYIYTGKGKQTDVNFAFALVRESQTPSITHPRMFFTEPGEHTVKIELIVGDVRTVPDEVARTVGSISSYSIDLGRSNSTTGAAAYSVGIGNVSSGTESISLGSFNETAGSASIAVGILNKIDTSSYNMVVGTFDDVGGGSSNTVVGSQDTVTGKHNTIVGSGHKIVGSSNGVVGTANIVDGSTSSVVGYYNRVKSNQHVIGNLNEEGEYAFAVADGESDSMRRNLMEIDHDGNAKVAGDLTIEGDSKITAEKISKWDVSAEDVHERITEICGKTEQDSYNGYQLFDISAINRNSYGLVVDGTTITVSGTNNTFAHAYFKMDVAPGDVLTLSVGSVDFSNATKGVCRMDFYNSNNQAVGYGRDSLPGKPATETAPAGSAYIRLKFYSNNSNVAATDYAVFDKVMLERGSVAHEYEPYTGGTSSPSPNYPQEIKSVDEIYIRHVKSDGTEESRTITPPIPLNKISEYADVVDIKDGVYRYRTDEVMISGSENWAVASDNSIFCESLDSIFGFDFVTNSNSQTVLCEKASWSSLSYLRNASNVANYNIGTQDGYKRLWFSRAFKIEDLAGTKCVLVRKTEETEPVPQADLNFLRNLTIEDGDHLYITDNHGRDLTYFINLMKDSSASGDIHTKVSELENDVPFVTADQVDAKATLVLNEPVEEISLVEEKDLEQYVKNTDYATSNRGGSVKVSGTERGTAVNGNGFLEARTFTYDTYNSAENKIFIGKGTLENVLADRLAEKPYELVATCDDTATESTYLNLRFEPCTNVLVEIIAYPSATIGYFGVCVLKSGDLNTVRCEFGALTAQNVVHSAKIESIFEGGLRRNYFSTFANANGRASALVKADTNGRFFRDFKTIDGLSDLLYTGHIVVNVYGTKA